MQLYEFKNIIILHKVFTNLQIFTLKLILMQKMLNTITE